MFDEFDRLFKRMSDPFRLDDILEGHRCDSRSGPCYYGYTMTVGPDGRPIIREYGNVKPGQVSYSDKREPAVDTIVDEKGGVVKLIAEMPGVEKTDVKVVVDGSKAVAISAERGDKKYQARVPLRRKVDGDSARASYKNGILQISFKLAEDRPAGRTVEVE